MMLRHEITVFMWCALLCPAENGNGTKGIFFRGLLWEPNEKKKKTSHSKTDRQAHGSTQQALALLLQWPKMVRDGNV